MPSPAESPLRRLDAFSGGSLKDEEHLVFCDPPLLHPAQGVSCKPNTRISQCRTTHFPAWRLATPLRSVERLLIPILHSASIRCPDGDCNSPTDGLTGSGRRACFRIHWRHGPTDDCLRFVAAEAAMVRAVDVVCGYETVEAMRAVVGLALVAYALSPFFITPLVEATLLRRYPLASSALDIYFAPIMWTCNRFDSVRWFYDTIWNWERSLIWPESS